MLTYEQDPDVVEWGLRLFESDPCSSYGDCGTITRPQDYVDYFNGEDIKEGPCCDNAGDLNVENDERIARALQAEMSDLAVEEMPECPGEGDEHFQVSDSKKDWSSGQDGILEKVGRVSCSLYSSPERSLYLVKEWPSCSLELAEQCASDGELGNWLNEMVPIRHVPRINGEIPSVDEASFDHQRLLDRLQVYDLVERKVQGDGNCQFRALSDQFYRTPEHHEFVRQQVVHQLKLYPETYEGYVPMAYGDYLQKMSRSGEWGDHVTLQAAADSYGVKIIVITSFKDTCYIEILPNVQRSERVILLSFWAEVHYNSISDVPAREQEEDNTLDNMNANDWI